MELNKLRYLHYSREGPVGIITINRPQVFNALNDEAIREFKNTIDYLGTLKDIRSVVITGIGQKSFCAGSDIEEMYGEKPVYFRNHSLLGHHLMESVERLRQPVVAAINGHAIGGGLDLALACDFRVAAEDAKLGLPEIKLNFPGGWGSAWRLPRLIGIAKTKELILLGNNIDAKSALKIGLLTRVVPKDMVLDEAKRLSMELSNKSPAAMELAKILVNHSFEITKVPFSYLESLSNAYCSTFDEFHERMGLFLKKKEI